jgi:beta-glucosidase
LIWGTDAVHGHNNVFGATLFPHPVGLGASHDPALLTEIGLATARAVRATGIAWVFAPTLAVARDVRWGRSYESYSEDPALVALLGGAIVEGLQRGLGGSTGVVATAKHFIGDGGTRGGQDQGVNTSTQAEMARIHAAGYTAALGAGVQAVMASFNSWNDVGAATDHGKLHGSRTMLTEVLKQRMGFDGLVVSDWNGIAQVPGCTASSCARAINAGIDMVMVPDDWKAFIANTIAQVRAGEIPMARIDDAVTRILRVKLRAGLFERRPGAAPQAGEAVALRARELARRAVRESLVLLKNDGEVLPLRRDARLLVVGKSADSLPNQAGGWSLSWQGTGHSNADFPAGDTVLAGLRAAGVAVDFDPAARDVDLSRYDAVLAVIGETPYAEGQGDIPQSATLHHGSRHPEDLALLQRVAGRGVPVVTVLISGRPLYVNDLLNHSAAFVAAWLPGTEGAGIADVLLRRADGGVGHDFSGRLSFSWPRSACQVPLHEGDGQRPLFGLGYGLAYARPSAVGPLDVAVPQGGCGPTLTPAKDTARP